MQPSRRSSAPVAAAAAVLFASVLVCGKPPTPLRFASAGRSSRAAAAELCLVSRARSDGAGTRCVEPVPGAWSRRSSGVSTPPLRGSQTEIPIAYVTIPLVGGEYCFRKFDAGATESVCRGLMDRRFKIKRGCCAAGGAAYSQELDIVGPAPGETEQLYLCSPCKRTASHHVSGIATVADAALAGQSGWSHWGNWSECSETCGEGFQRRERFCLSQRMIHCAGKQYELRACRVVADCPVDGAWGSWQPWSRCSSTCGRGHSTRVRHCDSPQAQLGGRNCSGAAVEHRECRDRLCSVDGSWGEWSYTSSCSVSCGQGTRTKVRHCNKPSPRRRGRLCTSDTDPSDEGSLYEEVPEPCQLPPCLDESTLSQWSAWSACTVTCGGGVQVRSRGSQCDPVQLKYGVVNCSGTVSETMPCHQSDHCPVDGGWSEWSEYSPCHAKPCGDPGTQVRTRHCSSPPPRHGGRLCEGKSAESRECYNADGCRVDGGWCEWHPWAPCLPYEPANRTMTMRMRSCHCPQPQHGGQPCSGKDYEVTSCDEASNTLWPFLRRGLPSTKPADEPDTRSSSAAEADVS